MKVENLNFEVFRLTFANFTRLTTVKCRGGLTGKRGPLTEGGGEDTYVPSLNFKFSHFAFHVVGHVCLGI